MKKYVFGKKLKRDTNERKALFKNLLTSLVLNEKIQTTEAKAKAIKGAADKLITKAKKSGREAYRALEADVHSPAVTKLIDDLASRFKDRNGGYTRIIKSGKRVADNAAMVVMEWVEKKSGELRAESGELKKDPTSPRLRGASKKTKVEKTPKQFKSPKKPSKAKTKEKKK